MSEEITTLPATATEYTPEQVNHQVQVIQHVMKKVMKEGEHYGKIPGCGDKPTLLKPGAEKLCVTFRLAPDYEEVSVTEEKDFISYRIKCKLIHQTTGKLIATGLGTCNSREKKYFTRMVYPNKATEEERATAIRTETRRGRNGEYDVLIIPQNPWDVQNTLYKMAAKRAQTAATLSAVGASDIFTQDIEDMEFLHKKEDTAPKKDPNRKALVSAQANDDDTAQQLKECGFTYNEVDGWTKEVTPNEYRELSQYFKMKVI